MVSVIDILKKHRDLVLISDRGQEIYSAQSVEYNKLGSNFFISFIDKDDEQATRLFHLFKGTCLIVSYELYDKIKAQHYAFSILLAKNPKLSFINVMKEFFYDRKRKDIHPSAVIGENVFIGAGTVIHANVVIYDGVKIGKNCKIKAGAVIGGHGFGYVQNEHEEWIHFPHIGTVILGDDVEVGSNTCIDRGTLNDTIIHNGVKIDNLVQVGHNVIVGKNTIITSCSIIGGTTKIGVNCWIAPNVSIIDNINIGDNVFVGLGAVVVKDVSDNTRVKGTPAKPF